MAAGLKTMIFGGAGFIGSHVASQFIELGADVCIIDGFLPNTGAHPGNISHITDQIRLIDNSVETVKDLARLVENADLIIDAMGLTAHHFGMAHPSEDMELNLLSHLHLIGALKNAKGRKVIYLGSRGQYGRVQDPRITEETPLNPVDVQGVAKTAAEGLYRIYAKAYGFDAISLRITNCFGENQKTDGDDIGLVGLFIRDLLAGRPVDIFGDISRTKNLIYVKDLAAIVTRISQQAFESFAAYNVAGTEISMKTLLDEIIRITGKGEYRVREFPDDVKNMDVGQSRFDGNKLEGHLGNLEYTHIRTALENTINYFRKKIDGA